MGRRKDRNRKYFIWLMLTALILTFSGVVPPVYPGFYCDDHSIQYKYQGDTVSIPVLLIVTGVFPYPLIVAIENFHLTPCHHKAVCGRVKQALRNGWGWYANFLLGELFTAFLSDFAKTLVSEARPHFINTCKPDFSKINCSQGYITNFRCTTEETLPKYDLVDAMKSFPSAHGALSFYAAIFLMCYFEKRVTTKHSYLLKPWLQVLWLSWAMGCSLTRITDHRHHWWDVLFGAVLGVLGAWVTIKKPYLHALGETVNGWSSTATNVDNTGWRERRMSDVVPPQSVHPPWQTTPTLRDEDPQITASEK